VNDQLQNLLWTPIRHNATQPNLFWVICYVGPETKDGSAEVPIGASDNLWSVHVWLEGGKDDLEAFMVELAAEFLKHRLLSLAFAC
jgi:hypothetical protein